MSAESEGPADCTGSATAPGKPERMTPEEFKRRLAAVKGNKREEVKLVQSMVLGIIDEIRDEQPPAIPRDRGED